MTERCEGHRDRQGRGDCRGHVVGTFRTEDTDDLGIPTQVRRLCDYHLNLMRLFRYRVTGVDAGGQLRLFGKGAA